MGQPSKRLDALMESLYFFQGSLGLFEQVFERRMFVLAIFGPSSAAYARYVKWRSTKSSLRLLQLMFSLW